MVSCLSEEFEGALICGGKKRMTEHGILYPYSSLEYMIWRDLKAII